MTLGDYRRFAAFAYGENSKATEYLDRKIGESPNGAEEHVVAAEHQMLMLLDILNQRTDWIMDTNNKLLTALKDVAEAETLEAAREIACAAIGIAIVEEEPQ